MTELEQTEVFRHRERAKQLINLMGLELGENLHPTDIDAVIEWKNRAYIFMEFKYENAPMPEGQRLCIERLVNDTSKDGKGAVALLIRHHAHNTEDDVDAAECLISKIYTKGQWSTAKYDYRVRDFVESFLSNYGYKKEKPEWTTNR